MRCCTATCTIPARSGSVGLPAGMEIPDPADEFIAAGLASLRIETDEVELAVIEATHGMFWPAIRGLLSLDLGDLEPEHDPDLSRAPEATR